MRRAAAATILLLLLLPGWAQAQSSPCTFDQSRNLGRSGSVDEGGGVLVRVFYDPFVVTCTDGTELRANSGRMVEQSHELTLLGSVFFQDSVKTLNADQAVYNTTTQRVWAAGNVVFVDRSQGITLRTEELEYYRETDQRPLSQVNATRRPTLIIEPRDTAENGEPMEVVGDELLIVGNEDLTATGNVVITRTDLQATAEEARYNSTTEELELRRNGIVRSEEREIRGEVIQASLNEGSLDYVQARTNASLTGEDLEVTAPDIQLMFESDTLRRVVARVPEEQEGELARAIAATFRVEADSLDAVFGDQVLEVVYAIGNARGETIDTTTVAATDVTEADLSAALDGAIDNADPPTVGSPAAAPTAEAPNATPPVAGIEPTDVAGDPLATVNTTGAGESSEGLDANDWILGDTIIAYFARVAPDTTVAEAAATEAAGAEPAIDPDAAEPADTEDPKPEMELTRLVAQGSAKSLYHVGDQNAPASERRNINFVAGDRVELEVAGGELKVANVTGLKRGLFLEAAPPAAPPAAGDQPVEPGDDAEAVAAPEAAASAAQPAANP